MSNSSLRFNTSVQLVRELPVPIWENDGLVSQRTVTDEDRRIFEEIIRMLKGLLENVSKLAKETEGTSEEDLLEIVADAVTIFFKAPLVKEISPVAPTPLKAYSIFVLSPKLRSLFLKESLVEFAEQLSELGSEGLSRISPLFDPETSDKVYRVWVAFPAGASAPLNTYSLIAYMLVVTSLSWALSFGTGKELSIIRLAAILKTLARALDPSNPVNAAKELGGVLLGGVISKERLDEIYKAIETDENIKMAEELATSQSKNVINSVSIVLVDFASIQEYIFRSQELRTVAVASHLVDLAAHAHFLIYLRLKGLRIPPEAQLYNGGGNIFMVLPAPYVQQIKKLAKEYSEKNGLKILVASSPFISSYPEASKRLDEDMHFEKHRVDLASQLQSLVKAPTPYEDGKPRLCTMCYSDWATTTIVTPARPQEVCERCATMYELGSKMHFKPKWESRVQLDKDISFVPEDLFEAGWDQVLKSIMEVIAGHDLPVEGRIRDYAVIKFDGNAMRDFMLSSKTLTDAVERSFRIDMALKNAYLQALRALYQGVAQINKDEARKEVARVYLGTIYMGGDDGFIIAPSWLAVPLGHLIAEEFSREIGLQRGLKVGIAVGPATMNVWSLLECASALMDLGKKALRQLEPKGYGEYLSVVAFDIYDSGSPSGATAKERIYRLSRKLKNAPLDENIDSIQPYFIKKSNLTGGSPPELWDTLGRYILFYDHRKTPAWTRTNAQKLYQEIFKFAFLGSHMLDQSKTTPEIERLRAMRRVALESWQAVSPSKYWRPKLVIFLARQIARRSKGQEVDPNQLAYMRLLEMAKRSITDKEMGPVPLADVLTLIKITKGGAW